MKMNRKEYMKSYLQKWRKKNKDLIKSKKQELIKVGYFTKWCKNNKESISLSGKKYRKNNKNKILEKNRIRQKRIKNLSGSHTNKEWNDLKKKFDYCCFICKKQTKLTKDHILPIWEDDSTNFIENIRPLCGSCNSRLGALYQYRSKLKMSNQMK